MKVDVNGNLYVATNRPFVSVYDNTGKHLGNIAMPESTSNCAFGGSDNKTLFITASTSVYRVQLKVQGVPVLVKYDNTTTVGAISRLVSTWG